MKQLIPNYTFNAASKTITFTDFDAIALERILLITNTKTNDIIYNFADSTKGGTVATNVLTLTYNTTAMSNSDPLQIFYDAKSSDPQYERMVVGNTRTKFRDGFESGLDTSVWDLTNDGSHLITTGGNSSGSGYLRISLNPLNDSSEVVLTSKQKFKFPVRVSYGVSASQRYASQEIFFGVVGCNSAGTVETVSSVSDKAVTAISVTANVATLTVANHGFNGGDRVVMYGCVESRVNNGPTTVTVVDKNTITIPTPGYGAGSPSATGTYIRYADPLRYASNGFGLLAENSTATNASFVSRRNGGKYRSVNSSIATTAASQTNTNPYTDSWNASSIQELYGAVEDVEYRSYPADSGSGMTALGKFSQGIPDNEKDYKLQIRARNLGNITKPIARITSITKLSGSTTATVTTDVPHGLTASTSFVQIYGVRDQTNFPNVTAPTSISATNLTANTFDVVIGTAPASNITSYGGTVVLAQNNLGIVTGIAQSIQSISRTSNVLTLVGNTTWSGLIPGEYTYIYGLESVALSYEGFYKVLRINTTSLELESTGTDFTSITTGGMVIKCTDVRLHFARVIDFTRNVTEVYGGRGNQNDANNAVPVTIAGSTTVPISQNNSSTIPWSAAGFGGTLVNDISSGALTTVGTTTGSSITPSAVLTGGVSNVGTIAHAFHVAVTAVAGTTPTLDVSIEESPDNGGNWIRIYDFPRITATGSYVSPLIPATWGTRYRYVRTLGGTATPSFTMAINRLVNSSSQKLNKQFIDRTIVGTTLNSVTPTWIVDGCTTVNATVLVTGGTVAPTLTFEGSEDNTNWYALGTAVTPTIGTLGMYNFTGIAPKFVRGRVSAAGTGTTAMLVTVKVLG
jgi:hypothetical protein